MEGRVYEHFLEGFIFCKKEERNEEVAKKGSVIKNFCMVGVISVRFNVYFYFNGTHPIEKRKLMMYKRMAGVMPLSRQKGMEPSAQKIQARCNNGWDI